LVAQARDHVAMLGEAKHGISAQMRHHYMAGDQKH